MYEKREMDQNEIYLLKVIDYLNKIRSTQNPDQSAAVIASLRDSLKLRINSTNSKSS